MLVKRITAARLLHREIVRCFTLTDAAGVTRASVEKPLTVIKVGNVILPGEPEGGLVVLRGTSVAMEVECEPDGAGMMLSTVFQTRKLRRRDNGYVLWPVDDDEEWNIAASNNYGSTGIYTPTTGGVYQVRSQVMLQGGSRGLCLAKRIWDTDEDGVLGIKKRGQWRAFGVCDAQWQIQLRNFALSFIGSSDYAFHAVLPAMYGYEEYDEGAYKCSIFVAHTIARANLNPPHRVVLSFQTGSGPSAAEWASEDYQIGHWPLLPLDAAPQPGFVSSTGGHCGILDFDGMGISAQNVFVTRKSELTCAQGRFRAHTQGETQ